TSASPTTTSSMSLTGTSITAQANLTGTNGLTLTGTGGSGTNIAINNGVSLDGSTGTLSASNSPTTPITYNSSSTLPIANLVGSGHNLSVTSSAAALNVTSVSGSSFTVGNLTLSGTSLTLLGTSATAATLNTGTVNLTASGTSGNMNVGG